MPKVRYTKTACAGGEFIRDLEDTRAGIRHRPEEFEEGRLPAAVITQNGEVAAR